MVEEHQGHGEVLLELYDRALPVVYGYLFDRCRDHTIAEDLTSETFLAAVTTIARTGGGEVSVPWIVGVARHKLVDHWRRRDRDEQWLEGAARDAAEVDDPWDAQLTSMHAVDVLGSLGGHHRAALTLRYVDGLAVPDVAEILGRTVHATEALLVRARSAFRKHYERGADDD